MIDDVTTADGLVLKKDRHIYRDRERGERSNNARGIT